MFIIENKLLCKTTILYILRSFLCLLPWRKECNDEFGRVGRPNFNTNRGCPVFVDIDERWRLCWSSEGYGIFNDQAVIDREAREREANILWVRSRVHQILFWTTNNTWRKAISWRGNWKLASSRLAFSSPWPFYPWGLLNEILISYVERSSRRITARREEGIWSFPGF